MRLKYIIYDYNTVAIFNDLISHDRMCPLNVSPISAGFVNISVDNNDLRVDCYGQSYSLGISSRPEDSGIVRKRLLQEDM